MKRSPPIESSLFPNSLRQLSSVIIIVIDWYWPCHHIKTNPALTPNKSSVVRQPNQPSPSKNVKTHFYPTTTEGSSSKAFFIPSHLQQQQHFIKKLPRIICKYGNQDVSISLPFPSTCTINADPSNSYFDVTWEGPVLDASGKQTSKVAGKLAMISSLHSLQASLISPSMHIFIEIKSHHFNNLSKWRCWWCDPLCS